MLLYVIQPKYNITLFLKEYIYIYIYIHLSQSLDVT